jgi:FixJ family two-component response regulator
MSDPRPTVYIVDDDVSIRESLEALVHVSGWQARAFPSASAFLDAPRAPGPSCLVLDLSLPDLNGLEVQAKVRDEGLQMPVIFISGYGDVPTTVRAMKGGATEFLTKPFGDDVLLSAVEAALEESRAAMAERAAAEGLRDRRASLSAREREVMDLVVAGLLNKQVGGELGISEITVKAHRGRVMEKMQADSLADLVRMSERLGLTAAAEGPRRHRGDT